MIYLCVVLRIITHIERVLLVNDCVIVPDFGGFVLRRCPALFVAEENAFSPAHNEIVFNPALNHNDGLLTESYMQIYGMDFNEAQQTLRQDLDEWKRALDEYGTVSAGRLGSFRRNEEGALIFEPEADASRYTFDTYGLTSFYMAPVGTERSHDSLVTRLPVSPQDSPSEETPRTEKTGREVPLLLRMMGRVAGIAVAAVVLFFLITTPVKDVNRNSYTAGFAPSEILTSTFSAGEAEKTSPVQPTKETDEPVDLGPSLPEPSVEPATGAVQKTIHSSTEIAIENVARRSYYVIIGSFDSRSRARKFVSEIDPAECRQIGMVRSGQRIRVYAAKYDNRAEAEAYVSRLRKTEKFKTSWLYIGHRDS